MKYLKLITLLFLSSCHSKTDNVSEARHIGNSSSEYIFEYTIDGHDYIKKGFGMAHSGTCKKCKQERYSIINLFKELHENSK